jgi:hypothetical protein
MAESWEEMGERLGFSKPPVVSGAMKAAAALLLVLPILGIAAHVAIWRLAPDWIMPYFTSRGMYAVIAVAAVALVASYLHYRRSRMRTVLVARVLCFIWMLSFALLLSTQMGLAGGE